MEFLDKLAATINSEQDEVGRYLDIFMYSYTTEELDNNLKGWKVQEITSKSIKIKLEFENILEVSQGDKNDKLVVKLAMDDLTDEEGNKLASLVILEADIPL